MKRKGDHLVDAHDIPEDGLPLDEQARILRDWPGYRTRDGRWGFDPVDSPAEQGRMESLFIKQLFTGEFVTHSIFYLAIMIIFGLMLGIIPPLLIMLEIITFGNWEILIVAMIGLPYIIFGWLLLLNVFHSLFQTAKV